jgi:endoglucanase
MFRLLVAAVMVVGVCSMLRAGVVHVGAVAPDILGITIQNGEIDRQPMVPYEPQSGDVIHEAEGTALVIDDGQIKQGPIERVLERNKQRLGYIVGGRDGKRFLVPFEKRKAEAAPLTLPEAAADLRILSEDDSNYAAGQVPLKLFRKTKPTDRLMNDAAEQLLRHTIYLQLKDPLQQGRTYRIEVKGTAEPIVYTHNASRSRSEAIHVNHLGYRPDDPYKVAHLSIWLGTGGGYRYDERVRRFDVLDEATRDAVFQGVIEQVLDKDATEKMRVEKNYSATSVYRLDFTSFTRPGRYVIRVPGVGCSDPFIIGATAYDNAFRASMTGFVNQRSGVALGPPVTDFVRPRDFHPDDGVRVFQSTVSMPDALKAGDWFKPLVDGRTEELVPGAWGGYHDAGDYDRHAGHLTATLLHLELLDLFPEFFAKTKLALPGDESSNRYPDLLDEALWNIDCYVRLQRDDGAVRGGIESSAHPRKQEPDFVDSLVVMAYAPDPRSSYLLAASAARASRLLERTDAVRAQLLSASAMKAFDWAVANEKSFADRIGEGYANEQDESKAIASAELLRLTRDAKYDQAFKDSAKVTTEQIVSPMHNAAAFAYTRLPADVGDASLKQQCRDAIRRSADAALAFADGNAFGITTEFVGIPEMGPCGYFTTPGMISQVLPRAHALFGEEKYLKGVVRACNFSLGANPDNMTFTTGVGHRSPRSPLHITSRSTGQPAPVGLTMYGSSDPARRDEFNEWVHKWFIGKTMVPDSYSWPATEFYVDFYLWPMMNEFTIHQNLGPTSYYWGYLMARGR